MSLSVSFKKYRNSSSWLLALVFVVCSSRVFAQTAGLYTAMPPSMADPVSPFVMLVMSRDHQLWYEAYTNYADMDGDGVIDTSYVDTVEYYGYFNSEFCYDYDTTSGIFAPNGRVSAAAAGIDAASHQCAGGASGGEWSGNFLNWVTTSRIDVVRKVLYGGYRHIDIPGRTVLQRAFIPPDNHAFVKTVSDADLDGATIADFTPLSETAVSFCNVTEIPANNGGQSLSREINIGSNPPKIKVAPGIYRAWAGNENVQCGWGTGLAPDRPNPNSISGISGNAQLFVRVEACVDGQDAQDTDSCRPYVDSSDNVTYKPYGLLQSYGESGEYRFGLLTGSYMNNTAGGVLRKNVVYMGGPDAADEDREVDSATGVFVNQTNSDFGIIKAIDRLRIQGWRYVQSGVGGNVYDDCDHGGISKSEFLTSALSDEQCRDWGNPISETYLEAIRYFANLNPTPEYNAGGASDSSLLPGLQTAVWQDPFTGDIECAKCSIIVLSTGLNNFDGDQLGSASGLPGLGATASADDLPGPSSTSLEGYTDLVGELEGLDVGNYLIGSNSGANNADARCTAKSLTNLSDGAGFCPEIPTLDGTFNVAGAAYYAHQNDLRSDLEGLQNVKTYTVSLAESLPSFEVQTGSESLTFLPTCSSNTDAFAREDDDDWFPCTIVDLIVDDIHGTANDDYYGRMLIAWEDSSWGNDNDSDAYVVIEYCTASGSQTDVEAACPGFNSESSTEFGDLAPNNGYTYSVHENRPEWAATTGSSPFQIRLALVGASAGYAMKFGYTISGSNDDGSYEDQLLRYGGWNPETEYIDPSSLGFPTIWSSEARMFSAVAGSPQQLNNPLWYAAKYGNFNEFSASTDTSDTGLEGVPDLPGEWDSNGDGIPDAYFPVSNPAGLPEALSLIFQDISQRLGAGSAVSINAINGTGEGALYQAIFQPLTVGENGDAVQWTGDIHSLFIDSNGRLREDNPDDTAGVGRLDDFDRVLEMRFDDVLGETVIDAYLLGADGEIDTATESTFPLASDDFNPVWSASAELNDLSQTALRENRGSYNSSASMGRYIITSVDRDGDGLVIPALANSTAPTGDDSEDGVYEFEFSVLDDASFYQYLGLGAGAGMTAGENLVNFIRGVEGIADMRSRTITDIFNPTGRRYLLGDIVHSSPVSVGKPHDRYDLLYGDETYREFYQAYSNRRQVIYAGANDGMLHAFNGGFFNASDVAFELSNGTDADATSHPLGSELWAYVPFNLLPHLQWLSSPDYAHVYYVDGPVQAFDVNIFPPSPTHVNGWGTIIVAGMRFGGGDFPVDHDEDPDTPDRTTRSAYVVLDVTNPELPPRLIAEITHPDLGFTTVVPTLVKQRLPGADNGFYSPSANNWYLVFASGPAAGGSIDLRNALNQGISGQNSSLFVFDLVTKEEVSKVEVLNSGMPEPETFVGGLTTADWNRDSQDDIIYFGLVGGTPAAPVGKLKRASISSFGTSTLSLSFSDLVAGTNADLAFSAPPLTHRSPSGENWIYAGTGRFYVDDDQLSNQQQYFFGIKEPENASGAKTYSNSVSTTSLINTTGVDTFEDGRVFRDGNAIDLNSDTEPEEVFSDVVDAVEGASGWMFQLRNPVFPHSVGLPHNRIRTFSKAVLAGPNVVFTAFEGTGEYCAAEGAGYLYAPHFAAGIAAPFSALRTDPNTTIPAVAVEGSESGTAEPVERVMMGDYKSADVPSEPQVLDSAGPCKSIITQSGSAEINISDVECEPYPAGRRGWREIPFR